MEPFCNQCDRRSGYAACSPWGACKQCEQELRFYKQRRKSGKDEYGYIVLKDKLARAEKYQRRQKTKEQRLSKAVFKVCSGCDTRQPHDPDDYLCIVCRDGKSALPTYEDPYYWSSDGHWNER